MLMESHPPKELLKELVPVTARGEATRRKLLASAEAEFGGKGFTAASVSSITQRADVGQGTFYLYFHSKEEIFAALVRQIGAALGEQLAVSGLDAPRQLVQTIGSFVVEHPGRHRLLREAQFIDAALYREVLAQLLDTIAAGLGAGSNRAKAAALFGAADEAAQWSPVPLAKGFAETVLAR